MTPRFWSNLHNVFDMFLERLANSLEKAFHPGEKLGKKELEAASQIFHNRFDRFPQFFWKPAKSVEKMLKGACDAIFVIVS